MGLSKQIISVSLIILNVLKSVNSSSKVNKNVWFLCQEKRADAEENASEDESCSETYWRLYSLHNVTPEPSPRSRSSQYQQQSLLHEVNNSYLICKS